MQICKEIKKNVKSTKSTKNWTSSLDDALCSSMESLAQKMAELLHNYVIIT